VTTPFFPSLSLAGSFLDWPTKARGKAENISLFPNECFDNLWQKNVEKFYQERMTEFISKVHAFFDGILILDSSKPRFKGGNVVNLALQPRLIY